jgi:hypothetical protein
MAEKRLVLEKLEDGEAGVTYALVKSGENPKIICEMYMFQNPDGLDYRFSYTDEFGKTTPYPHISANTREEGSKLMKRLLEQKVTWMARSRETELQLFDNS